MKRLLRTLALSIGLVGLIALPVGAATTEESLCTGAGGTYSAGGCNAQGTQKVGSVGDLISNVTNIILFITGAIAVIMIIVGGIRYVVSGGDGKAATDARNTVVYAAVGLIVAFLSWGAVQFVIRQLDKP